ncbi:MAG: D-aminoacyl-tRNA deacylase [Kiritimatiellae bacterium]|nr:D-aminoacyl-tRNA deacylase [Kiritimatiellia bacterium]
MRAVVQRVRRAAVEADGRTVAEIGAGGLVLLGIGRDDTAAEADWLARKIARLRIFDDSDGRMNLDIRAVGGQWLVVSQFTLLADCAGGHRPSFIAAAPAEVAEQLYLRFVDALRDEGTEVRTGIFRARMLVHLVNDGPVTLVVDTPTRR